MTACRPNFARAESGLSLTRLARSMPCIPSILRSRTCCTESRRGFEPFWPASWAFAFIGIKTDITPARTTPNRTANLNCMILLSVLNCLLLDPVIFFQSYGVFQFLSNFRENRLVHSGAASFFEPHKQVFHALEHRRDRTDRVVHHLVAHRFQIPNREDGSPKPISFTVHEDQRHAHCGRRFACFFRRVREEHDHISSGFGVEVCSAHTFTEAIGAVGI